MQLQCSYQGQQGDVRQSVRGNHKTSFSAGQNLTAVVGNASVHQVNTVSVSPGRPMCAGTYHYYFSFVLELCSWAMTGGMGANAALNPS